MKTKLKANYNLLLGKMLIIPNMIIVVRSVFQENSKYYPQFYSHQFLYGLMEKL